MPRTMSPMARITSPVARSKPSMTTSDGIDDFFVVIGHEIVGSEGVVCRRFAVVGYLGRRRSIPREVSSDTSRGIGDASRDEIFTAGGDADVARAMLVQDPAAAERATANILRWGA